MTVLLSDINHNKTFFNTLKPFLSDNMSQLSIIPLVEKD